MSRDEASKLLQKLLPILDEAFFFNLVQGNLGRAVKLEYHDGRAPKDDASYDGCYDKSTRRIHVNTFDYYKIDDDSFGKRRVEVLLHEMLHAFLITYTCKCRSCREIVRGGNGAKVTVNMMRTGDYYVQHPGGSENIARLES